MNVPDRLKWSFVIPNYNGAGVLEKCIDSVLAAADASGAAGEVIVVDDASTDGSVELLAGYGDRIKVIISKTNRGFSSTCNQGFAAASGRVVFLINNDVQVEPDIIGKATRHFKDAEVFAVSFKAVDENGALRIGRVLPSVKKGFLKGVPDDGDCEEVSPTFFASGGGAAFSPDKFAALGGFDENMNPFYWEDVDLSYRALKRGWKVLYDPGCRILHPAHGVITSTYKRRHADVISRRNQLQFMWKNADSAGLIAAHALYLFLKIAGCIVTFRFDYLKSIAGAVGVMPAIRAARAEEKKHRKMTGGEVVRIFGRH